MNWSTSRRRVVARPLRVAVLLAAGIHLWAVDAVATECFSPIVAAPPAGSRVPANPVVFVLALGYEYEFSASAGDERLPTRVKEERSVGNWAAYHIEVDTGDHRAFVLREKTWRFEARYTVDDTLRFPNSPLKVEGSEYVHTGDSCKYSCDIVHAYLVTVSPRAPAYRVEWAERKDLLFRDPVDVSVFPGSVFELDPSGLLPVVPALKDSSHGLVAVGAYRCTIGQYLPAGGGRNGIWARITPLTTQREDASSRGTVVFLQSGVSGEDAPNIVDQSDDASAGNVTSGGSTRWSSTAALLLIVVIVGAATAFTARWVLSGLLASTVAHWRGPGVRVLAGGVFATAAIWVVMLLWECAHAPSPELTTPAVYLVVLATVGGIAAGALWSCALTARRGIDPEGVGAQEETRKSGPD